MKSLTLYIQEKLVIRKNNYKYFPETKKELREIIDKRIKDEGIKIDLNDIDVSNITDMTGLFLGHDFNGDISEWNVSNVTSMEGMLFGCKSFDCNVTQMDNFISIHLFCKQIY